jgi:TPR repeat protein
MEETVREELLAKTQEALAADNWDAVVRLWEPWVQQGDAEAEYQVAYHYLWCTSCDDDATRERMNELIKDAAAKEHPDATWFLGTRTPRESAECERLMLRAGQLGSANAQRELGVMYATGEWAGPKDLVEAARWYRLAAEQGHAKSQYDLGFMLLLGEGGHKSVEEGLIWLERAGEKGEFSAFRLLTDCYENGHCDVPRDPAKAAQWRSRMEEWLRLHPVGPTRRYSVPDAVDESYLECVWNIEGVDGLTYMTGDHEFAVSYEPERITPAQLDEHIRADGLAASPIED